MKKIYFLLAIAIVAFLSSCSGGGEYEQVIDYDTFDHVGEWIEIMGRAPFKYGLKEIKFRPGLYIRGGMAFEIGSSRLRAQSIEVGATAEYFPQGLVLMAENPKAYLIPTLYLSYHWGSRYNRY